MLTGLTPNTDYDVVLYEKQYDTSTGRTFSVGYDVGNTGTAQFTSPTIDQNHPESTTALSALGIAQSNAWGMSYVFATGPGQTSIALDVNNSTSATYHFYGLTNQVLGPAGQLNILSSSTSLSINSGATFDLSGNSQQVASLSDYSPNAGGSVINSASGTFSALTLNLTAGPATFSGGILGGGTLGAISLTLNGAGTQVLAGSNTYTGGTAINAGTLEFATTSAMPSAGTVSVAGERAR